MKSKFTSILMFFIVLAIFGVLGILGFSFIQEFIGSSNDKTEQASVKTETSNSENDNKTIIENTIEKNIETPKIKVNESSNTNPLEELENGSNSTSQINYDSISVNKYFYNQLDSTSQIIYKAFESNKQNMKTGTFKIALGDSFTNVLSRTNGQDELGDYYQSAIEAYLYDNPDVFYLSPNKMYLNIETTTRGNSKTYNTFIDCGEQANYFTDEFNSKYEVETAVQTLESIKQQVLSKRTGNTYEDIKMVHDYLINSIDYDNTVSEKNIYNIYGALVNKKCVCEGYAKALKYLLDGMGIDNTLVIGTATNTDGQSENHAWNYVKLNGVWYAIDSTWDDPIIIGNGYVSDNIKYKYFLKGSNTMNSNHFPSGTFTEGGKIFVYPNLNMSDY
ncbi:MAG: hypothetical protein IKF97_00765 [Clostridia bacterium]|nr:hypothetical protein [Clostridia bacterium]